MSTHRLPILLATMTITLLTAAALHAQTHMGTAFKYQGHLTDSGSPATGQYDFEFTLFEDEAGTSQVGSPVAIEDKQVTGGLFAVSLDFGPAVFYGDARWLRIGVRPYDSVDPYTHLDPLQEVTPLPYALHAGSVSVPLDLAGSVASPGAVIKGVNSGDGEGVLGSSESGVGVYGLSTNGAGVYGESDSTEGRGVYGYVSATSGWTIGLFGVSDSSGGEGVHGYASATSGATYGVVGHSASTSGLGVKGAATASSGTTYGVFGRSDSTSGRGVYGEATASSGTTSGVLGRSESTSGQGVLGVGSATSGSSIGVKGQTNSPDGFAGYFVGGKNYFEGNVGIGTTGPDRPLAIRGHGAYNQWLSFKDATDGATLWHVNGNGGLNFAESGVHDYRLFLEPGGNVGIGTPWPEARLHVDQAGSGNGSAVQIGPRYAGGASYNEGSQRLVIAAWGGSGGLSLVEHSLGGYLIENEAGDLTFKSGWDGTHGEKVRITSDGNVGIGTATPWSKLHIHGGPLRMTGDYSSPLLLWGNVNTSGVPGADSFRCRYDNDFFNAAGDALVFEKTDSNGDDPDGGIVFTNTGNDGVEDIALAIRGSGNVGIGTTSPTATLDIVSSGAYHASTSTLTVRDVSNRGTLFLESETDQPTDFVFKTNGLKRWWLSSRDSAENHDFAIYRGDDNGAPLHTLTIDRTHGNVGIGTSTPAARLEVVGSIMASSSATTHKQGAHLEWNKSGGNGETWVLNQRGWGAGGIRFGEVDTDDTITERMRINHLGNVGIGTASPSTRLEVNGTTTTDVLAITGGSDLSERFEVTTPTGKIEPGMVVIIDANHPGQLKLAKTAYDRKVAGIISGANGLKPGMVMAAKGQEHADGDWPVALSGRVWCWCDASSGSIEPGDLLTTSDTPGHAMKVTEYPKAQGAIIGKAMTSLQSGQGLVLVLVSLQ